jgi:phosphate transport system permease protein
MPTSSANRVISGLMFLICALLSVILLGVLLGVAGYLFIAGGTALLTMIRSHAADQRQAIERAAAATIQLASLGAAVALPVGLAAGIYLAEFSRRSALSILLRWGCDALAGIPGIVVGIAVYLLLAVPTHGDNPWAGAAALAVVMAPAIARVTQRILLDALIGTREAAAALGAGTASTLLRVVLPSVAPALVAAIALVVACSAFEAAPLLFAASSISPLPVQAFQAGLDPQWRALPLISIFLMCALTVLASLAAEVAVSRRNSRTHQSHRV